LVFDSKLKDPELDRLYAAVLELKTVEECYRFFYDLCTIGELRAMAQRFAVAQMLSEGKSYTDIALATGASTATISRVKRFLDYGADGYRLILERLRRQG